MKISASEVLQRLERLKTCVAPYKSNYEYFEGYNQAIRNTHDFIDNEIWYWNEMNKLQQILGG